ncbi:radical SAM protein [Treponema sp. Marseille-Q4130]|uniref:radical SAM protein n=1 Tax=Treponema sp. Marseille-Q4130 TaxID=2766702 RepID=UPI00165245FA|nr:radical SAM protein [Treponema sp. Marseille-Q4130]MBC6721370.1 radical SAM protein [Treponema sp. Marseille-Q4130]
MISEIALEITQKCPNNCIYCSSCSSWNANSYIEFDVIKEVIQDMSDLGIKKLCISGGEPFLHPDVLRIINFASERKIEVTIYSSGIVRNIDQTSFLTLAFLKACKKNGLSSIIFNMQAGEEKKYNEIMKTLGNFPKLIESIKNAKLVGLEAEIHFVPMKVNIDQIEFVISLSEKIGIRKVSFLKLVPQGRAFTNKNLIELNEKEYCNFNLHLKELSKSAKIDIRLGIPFSENTNIKCHAVSGKLAIRYDGAVLACEAFKGLPIRDSYGNEILPDNIKTRRLKDILQESEYLKACKIFIDTYSKSYSCCENCPVQKYIKETK